MRLATETVAKMRLLVVFQALPGSMGGFQSDRDGFRSDRDGTKRARTVSNGAGEHNADSGRIPVYT
jgi:hypothetical protein